ncbi:hypothetical protein CMV_028069, partial [Castanea mollissima]
MEPRIDDEPQILHPGPIDESLLMRQQYHRLEDIWNGEYWAWARLPFLCPRIEPPPGCDYGPWPYAPLAFKWVRVPSSKSRPSGMALIHYREQLVRMQPDQIMWQPYEADFGHLPDFCVAGRDMWTARHEADVRPAWDRRSWMVKGEHLILKRFSLDISASEVDFSTTEFWIQVHGLPLNQRSEENLLKIGSTAGRALETDFVGSGVGIWRNNVRVRAEMDTS